MLSMLQEAHDSKLKELKDHVSNILDMIQSLLNLQLIDRATSSSRSIEDDLRAALQGFKKES